MPILTKNQAKKLAKTVEKKPEKTQLTAPFARYLECLLEDAIFDRKTLLPKSYLHKSLLKDLLYLTKKQLVEIIHSLSLEDYAASMKQIVQPDILQEIHQHLAPKEQKLLTQYRATKEHPLFPPAPFKDLSSFTQEMHKRGIYRLGIAIQKEPEDFIWYISRTLDCGRGKMLLAAYEKKALANVQEDMLNCLLTLLQDDVS